MKRVKLPKRMPPARRSQQGAVLYVALIILVLLALIGVIGMQVASMQERMSSDYRLTNLAFQRAEGDARRVEQEVMAALYTGSGTYAADIVMCDQGYIPAVWADAVTESAAEQTRRLDTCFPGGSSLKVGQDLTEQTGNVYQITTYSEDQDVGGTSEAVIDTVFIP